MREFSSLIIGGALIYSAVLAMVESATVHPPVSPSGTQSEPAISTPHKSDEEAPPVAEPGVPTYSDALGEASESQRPLIVFVGCSPRTIDGAVTVRWDDFPGVEPGQVVVSVFKDGSHYYEGSKEESYAEVELERLLSLPPPPPVRAFQWNTPFLSEQCFSGG